MLRTSTRAHRAASALPLPRWLLLLFSLIVFGTGLTLLPFALSFLQSFLQSPVLSLTQPATAAAAASLYSDDAQMRDQAIEQLAQLKSAEATSQLLTFFQHDEYIVDNGLSIAHALAGIGTPQSLRVLIHSLGSDASESRRMAAMAGLEEARPSADGLLVSALDDADAVVRENAARLLGYRHAGQAGTALLAASHDVQPAVREAAAWSLSEVAGVQALSRLDQMALLDNDTHVRETAALMVQRIYARASAAIEAPVRAIAVAPSGQAYAATVDALYTLREQTWQPLNVLSDSATALAVGDDGRTLYLGTLTRGLLRSTDGGQRFDSLAALPAGLGVSALCVNPLDTRQVFVALAEMGSLPETQPAPRGVFYSADGGVTWQALEGAPQDEMSVQLLMDPSSPRYVFGATGEHAWRANVRE